MKKETILIVDDDPKLVKLACNILGSVGYSTITAMDGRTVIEKLSMENPDLILLDIILGNIDGYEICRQIREFSTIPIIMLTSKAKEADKVKGFELGADDYLTKPFSAKELIARIKAILRRVKSLQPVKTKITFENLSIDLASRKINVHGKDVKFTPTEFKLLKHLVNNEGKVITHEDILSEVWGAEYRNDIDYLRTYIKSIRKKIQDNSIEPRFIKTVSGVGYYFSSI